MVTLFYLSLLGLAMFGALSSQPRGIERQRRKWRAEVDIGPALQRRWLRR